MLVVYHILCYIVHVLLKIFYLPGRFVLVNHYNAFISYRHSEKDSAVAAEVQHQLEHFHIPRAIRKSTGVSKISRLFRDKEELPITSDLNHDIGYALEHSDFLIVICSESTSESLWVPREIETFLKYHTKKRVLTVLADGEPVDVIPDMLLHEEVEQTDENGQVHTVSVPIEPLSCDYRMPLKKARKEELPRLAASLLGCSYDELVLRQRQYRIHRIMTVFAAALTASVVAASYLLWSGIQIRSNYQKSLENQSRYLANESLKELEDTDRISATQLALAALPSKDNRRPVIPEAEYALGCAIDAYQAPDSSYITSTWKFNASGRINEFFTSEDGSVLFAFDNANTVWAWTIESHKQLFTRSFAAEEVIDILNAGSHRLVIVTDQEILCYDTSSWKILWSAQNDFSISPSDHIAASSDDSGLLAVADVATDCIHLYDISSGKKLPDAVPDADGDLSPISIFFYGDGTMLAAECYDEKQNVRIALYNTKTESFALLPDKYTSIVGHLETDDGKMYVADMLGKGIGTSSYGYYDAEFLYDSTCAISCYDLHTMKRLWEKDIPYQQIMYNAGMNEINFTDADGAAKKLLEVNLSNLSIYLNENDGSVYDQLELPASVISTTVIGDTGLDYFLENGSMGTYSFVNDKSAPKIMCRSYFTDKIESAILYTDTVDKTKGMLIQQHFGSSILVYHDGVYDKDWKTFKGDTINSGYIKDSMIISDHLAVLTSGDDKRLYLYDVASRKQTASIKLDQDTSSTFHLLGSSPDQKSLYMVIVNSDSDDHVLQFAQVNLDSGKMETFDMPCPDMFRDQNTSFSYQDGYIFYQAGSFSDVHIYKYSVTTHKGSVIPAYSASSATFSSGNSIFASDDGSLLFILNTNGKGQIISSATGVAVSLKEQLTNAYSNQICAEWNSDQSLLAVTAKYSINLYQSDGTLKASIPYAKSPSCMTFYKDMLLVLSSSGELDRYSVKDGSFLGETDVKMYSNALAYVPGNWTFTDDTLYLNDGSIMNIIDLASWTETAYVLSSLDYCPAEDIFCASSNNSGTQIGFFPHYTTDDLIRKAKDMLGDHVQLSDTMKSRYGIN